MEEYEDYREDEPCTSCPQCQRSYDDIDYDFQCCTKCGWDAELKKFTPEAKREPSEGEYLSGDADVLTGQWY